jgi:hypothetical protein
MWYEFVSLIFFLKIFSDYSGPRKQISSGDFVIFIYVWIYLFWDHIGIVKLSNGKEAAVGLRYITVILRCKFYGMSRRAN